MTTNTYLVSILKWSFRLNWLSIDLVVALSIILFSINSFEFANFKFRGFWDTGSRGMMACFVWTVHPLLGFFWSKHIIQEKLYLIIAFDQRELKLGPWVGRSLVSKNSIFVESLLCSTFGFCGFLGRACTNNANTWRIWLNGLAAWYIQIASPQVFFLSETSISVFLT